MFSPDAPWEKAAAHTQVFVLGANPFIDPIPQETLKADISDLERRHIAIAVETGVMNVPGNPRPNCGGWGWVEGYGPVPLHKLVAEKIKKAGGVIKYIAMDEPLWYGHYFTRRTGSQPGCQETISNVAKLAAPSLKEYIRVFPSVLVGDIEPANLADASSGRGRDPSWQRDLAEWATDFRKETGRSLAFLQIDVGWVQPDAVEHALQLYYYAQSLKHQGLIAAIGFIYNGNPTDMTDAAWTRSAREHIVLMQRKFGVHPDQAVIQSWHIYPSHVMPESSPDTLASVVDFYTAQMGVK